MQPNDENQDYQQPSAQGGGAPYQPVAEPPVVPQPPLPPVPTPEYQPTEPQTQPEEPAGEQPAADNQADATAEDESAVLRWDGPECLAHDRGAVWYVVFGLVTLALMAVAIIFAKSITFTVLIPVMAAALFVYTRREPQVIHYTLSRKGLHVNDKLYSYDTLKSFAVSSHAGSHSVILVPRKRFQLAVTAYFPETVGEPLVDMLAARLPMQTHAPDFMDKLLTKLRI